MRLSFAAEDRAGSPGVAFWTRLADVQREREVQAHPFYAPWHDGTLAGDEPGTNVSQYSHDSELLDDLPAQP